MAAEAKGVPPGSESSPDPWDGEKVVYLWFRCTNCHCLTISFEESEEGSMIRENGWGLKVSRHCDGRCLCHNGPNYDGQTLPRILMKRDDGND